MTRPAPLSFLVFLAAAACGTPAVARDKAQAEKPPEKTPEVVVKGKRPDVVDKIDRRTYDIRNDPQAKSGVIADVLKKLPSVTLTPDGQVELRGDANVTVMIDGKVPPDGNAAIRTLPADRVDKVEIITNPSAQYAPDGTAGIINIITDKRRIIGFSGSTNAALDSFGNHDDSATVSFTRGPWTFGGGVDGFQGGGSYHGGQFQQTLNPLTNTFDELQSDTRGRGQSTSTGFNLMAAYKLSDKASLSVTGTHGDNNSHNDSVTHYHAASGDFSEASSSTWTNAYGGVDAIYHYTDDARAEKLTLDANSNGYHNHTTTTQATTSAASPVPTIYGSARDGRGVTEGASGEYERTFDGRILVAGASFSHNTTTVLQDYANISGGTGPQAADSTYVFDGARDITAIYATYQMPLGKWSILPGLRAEAQSIDLPLQTRRRDVSLYPSLHLSRDLGTAVRLKLSYSRRIQRPDLSMYDPTIEYNGATNAYSGNPDLKPISTDAYEASYDFNGKTVSSAVTIYYRVNHGDWSPFIRRLPNGVLLNSTVNDGHSRSGGAELSLRGPLSKHVKYAVNADLFYRELVFSDGSATQRRGAVATFGNANLEYDADKRGGLDGDQYQVTLSWRGRNQTLQGYNVGNYSVDASYRRALNAKVAVVVTAIDIFNSNVWSTVTDTPTLKVRPIVYPRGPIMRVALAWKFGAGN